MARLPSIPPPSTPFLNADGTVNRIWYLHLYNLTQQSIGVKAATGAAGAVSPGSGQADAAILWGGSSALL